MNTFLRKNLSPLDTIAQMIYNTDMIKTSPTHTLFSMESISTCSLTATNTSPEGVRFIDPDGVEVVNIDPEYDDLVLILGAELKEKSLAGMV